MIEDLVESAKEELKRADHSIHVSLKYARTVDIMKNIIKRLISACSFAILEVLEYLKEKKKIKEIPGNETERVELVLKKFPDLNDYIKFYDLLKNIDKAEYTKREEYRKNVAFIVSLEGQTMEINVVKLKELYGKTDELVNAFYEKIKIIK